MSAPDSAIGVLEQAMTGSGLPLHGEQRLRDALKVASWWDSLRALECSHADVLRAARYPDDPDREGINLFQLIRRLTAGAP